MENRTRTYGAVVRVFANNIGDVSGRVDRALGHAKYLLEVQKMFPALERIAFVIPCDADCGQTYSALKIRFLETGLYSRIKMLTFSGNQNREVLNNAINKIVMMRVTHALILSGKAVEAITPMTLGAIDSKFADGAKAAGLAFDELAELVLSGCLQNTCMAWEIKSLIENTEGFENIDGIEEIAPLVHLAREYGRCIAPIMVPSGAKLDVHTDEASIARHRKVMETKQARIHAELARLMASPDVLMQARM